MLDIHCHILPGVDDGAKNLDQSLAMARIAVAEGVTTIACTPHMTPGVYDNRGPDVIARVEALQLALDEAGVPLQLVAGADVHVAPDVTARLRSGEALSLNRSRYVLVEPPHHVAPPRLDGVFFDIAAAGYQAILTHPERLTWIERRFDLIERLFHAGVWMQITAASLEGQFGSKARYWAELMLDEGMVHVVASDAHDERARPPRLRNAGPLVDLRILWLTMLAPFRGDRRDEAVLARAREDATRHAEAARLGLAKAGLAKAGLAKPGLAKSGLAKAGQASPAAAASGTGNAQVGASAPTPALTPALTPGQSAAPVEPQPA